MQRLAAYVQSLDHDLLSFALHAMSQIHSRSDNHPREHLEILSYISQRICHRIVNRVTESNL